MSYANEGSLFEVVVELSASKRIKVNLPPNVEAFNQFCANLFQAPTEDLKDPSRFMHALPFVQVCAIVQRLPDDRKKRVRVHGELGDSLTYFARFMPHKNRLFQAYMTKRPYPKLNPIESSEVQEERERKTLSDEKIEKLLFLADIMPTWEMEDDARVVDTQSGMTFFVCARCKKAGWRQTEYIYSLASSKSTCAACYNDFEYEKILEKSLRPFIQSLKPIA